MSEDQTLRRRIAEELLGAALDADCYAPCPGAAMHSHKGGKRDFRVVLSGAPTGYCFHDSCAGAVEHFNRELRSRIGKAEAEGGERMPSIFGQTAPRPVEPRRMKRPPYQPEVLERLANKCPVEITPEWLRQRSPVSFPENGGKQGVETITAFLNALYRDQERVLIFTAQYSQGDFLFTPATGGYRLANKPGVKAVPSELPIGAPEGVWFLVQPVEGIWKPNDNNKGKNGKPKLGRRHGDCVTSWRHLVLESDDAPEGLWLKALVQLPFPIVAIYTSGGRSVHALLKVDCKSKAAFDALRDDIVQILAPLGADAAAMTAVRLSRLPGALRYGKRDKEGNLQQYPAPLLQRLLWLNPHATTTPILHTVRH